MSSATPLVIQEKSQEALVQFHKQCYSMLNQQWNIREQMRQADLAYMRETDWTKENQSAKLANRYGDSTKFQNVVVPVVMPQVESAVTYQASVFLTGSPIFGWVAPPESEDAAVQYQAVIEENSIRGGWVQQLLMAFRDGFKYNLGIAEVTWDRVVTAAIETDPSFGKDGRPKEVIWQGNSVRRWDPYNSFWDARYKPTEIYKNGEFCGHTELMSRVHLKKFINELPDKMVSNIKAAFESGMGANAAGGVGGIESYYIPTINPDALMQIDPKRSTDWMSWAGILERPPGEIIYKNLYEVTTLYARIIPQDFRLRVPGANTPQVWKLIIVNHQVLIYAERQTNAHAYLPTLFLQPNEDGLGYQTKSLASNAKPFQEIASALVNSAMAARRRAISDRGIYNPQLISAAHINNDSPTAKIPMRPTGYNKHPNEAYFPIPYRDDQSAVAFQELPQMLQMANTVNGQNQAKQGQFVKGNKTQHEYESVMANANGRDQICSMLLEAQFFTPMKEIIKINTLQYQAGTEIFSPSRQQTVKIDPVQLRKSFSTFKITDGLTPTDKAISGDDFTVALQTLGSSQAIGAGYNMAPAFSYLMKTRNVNLAPFEKSPQQMAYEQAMAQWQNAAAQVAELAKTATMKIEGITLKDLKDMVKELLPAQPNPQQFGYTPGAPANEQGQAPGAANMSQVAAAQQGAK
jgi:hypothetical protein